MIRATTKINKEFLVDKTLEDFDYLMENKGDNMKFISTTGQRFLMNEVSDWHEVGNNE